MIALVDYKLGNLGSVYNMLKYLGYESEITSNKDKIIKADKLILSGVGSFDAGIRNLHNLGLYEVLMEKVLIRKTPVLGICLGMQLMGTSSEEGEETGFGWIKGTSVKFNSEEVRIPHMNWNHINLKANIQLFKGLNSGSKFYFAHSFHFIPEDGFSIAAESSYGDTFVAVIKQDNILGVQFHPEKSHRFGMKLLTNFVCEY